MAGVVMEGLVKVRSLSCLQSSRKSPKGTGFAAPGSVLDTASHLSSRAYVAGSRPCTGAAVR
eukprot:7115323-Ditylum_brightwellii.AAC.1